MATWTKGGTSVEFTPDYPSQPGQDKRQTLAFGMGGHPWSVTHDSSTLRRPVVRGKVPAAVFAEIESFLVSTVNLRAQDFTYTDDDGNSYSVRYVRGLKSARRVGHNYWYIEIYLAEVPS